MGEDDAASPNLGDPQVNANDIISWLERQPETSLTSRCQELYNELLAGASGPRHSSVLACTRLCGFVQHCTKSRHAGVQAWAFSEPTVTRLFNFYIEWNEKDQHRSMRLVLDLLTVLISQNPDAAVSASVRSQVLVSLVSIISRKSSRPLVKSCIGSLNHLFGKGIYGLEDVARTYRDAMKGEPRPLENPEREYPLPDSLASLPDLGLWRRFCGDLVSWMTLHYVCSVAGKFMVTIYRALRAELAQSSNSDVPRSEDRNGSDSSSKSFTVHTWLGWLREELGAKPSILENVKLYIFGPLFKTDLPASLELLDSVNQPGRSSSQVSNPGELDSDALLRLAALEVGKKSGLVEDPGSQQTGSQKLPTRAVVLDVRVMESVLTHPSPPIRLLALSLLVTSPSSSKPYPEEALALIRRHLPAYHADPGPWFRQEALAHAKVMIKRIKGTIAAGQRIAANHGAVLPQTKGNAKTKLSPAPKYPVDEETVSQHVAFYKWYQDFLLGELVPTASYQRHITALRATIQFLQFGKEVASNEASSSDVAPVTALVSAASIFLDYSWIHSILDLVVDPFSDVRETAISLLMLAPPEAVEATLDVGRGEGAERGVKLVDVVRRFRDRASSLASRTGRADHGDGSARLQGLLCSWSGPSLDMQLGLVKRSIDEINKKLEVARSDIARAVMEYPVHGDFASISCMWDVLTKAKYSDDQLERLIAVQRRVLPLCIEIWDIVRPILCDDSPEGHLPQEMEDAEGLDTKGLLSYSFRAIHESSNTMRLIISPLKFSRVKGTLCPSRDVFEAVGSLTFDQLSNLRHRGAFTTVSLTFTTCCQLVGDPSVTPADSPAEDALLFAWYMGTLDCIFAQTSTTRRSAGIPALMTGILAGTGATNHSAAAAAAATTRPSFDEVMTKLGEIAQKPALISETDGSNLPQVHALNCIKDVFKSSLLSIRAERYLPTFLQVAASSLRSEVWAIRNCGLLLLRSVIDCLLGNADSKALLESGWDGRTNRISYVKYPALPTILLGLLQDGEQNPQQQGRYQQDTESQRRAAESVFPALDIIRRAGPPDSHRDELYACVAGYLASHLWHVREIAARTLSSFLISMDWLAEIRVLLERSRSSANMLHGILLTTKFFLEKGVEALGGRLLDNLPLLDLLLVETVTEFKILQTCPEIQAVHSETLSLISSLYPSDPSGPPKQQEPENIGVESRGFPSEDNEPDEQAASPALLQIQLSLEAVRRAASSGDASMLRTALLRVSKQDTNAAVVMMEAVPRIWGPSSTASPALCRVYIDVARQVNDAGIRAAALRNLTEALDALLLRSGGGTNDSDDAAADIRRLPPGEDLMGLWDAVMNKNGEANPMVLHACIRASGPLMAVLCLQGGHGEEDAGRSLGRQLRVWAETMSSAGQADYAYDTRESAVLALQSFTSALGGARCTSSEACLPFLLAIYDALNDDDDEIRDIAAAAAAPILSLSPSNNSTTTTSITTPIPPHAKRLINPIQAASDLLDVLRTTFATSRLFHWCAVQRAMGEGSPIAPVLGQKRRARLTPPRARLNDALAAAADDSLFVVEEQNLFVDEVREARRWCGVLEKLPLLSEEDDGGIGYVNDTDDGVPSPLLPVLRGWVYDGLVAMAAQCEKRKKTEDGPLGWTSAPGVFDVCSRVVLGGVVLARGHGDEMMREPLVAHREMFARAGVHGVLLRMLDEGCGR